MLEELGEETDGAVESVSKLQSKIKALSGVDILTESGEYKDTYTILQEIGQVWKDMSDVDQAALLELMAGKNRANTLSAILGNMEDLESAYESALKAEGSALAENQTYLDSIQGRVDLFKNTTQTLWMNFVDTDAAKFVVNLGTELLKVIDKIGVLKTALFGVLWYFTAIKKQNPITIMQGLVSSIVSAGKAKAQIAAIQSFNTAGGTAEATTAFNTASVDAYAASVRNLTAAQQAQRLAEAGLNKEQITSVLTKNGVTDATQRETLAEQALAASRSQSSAVTVADIISSEMLENATDKVAASEWHATNATKQLTFELLKQAVELGVITPEAAAAASATYGLVPANNAAAFSFKALGVAMKTAFLSNPVGLILSVIGIVITATSVFNALNTEVEDFSQKASQLKNEWNSASGEIKDNIKTLKGLKDEFKSLSACVDDYGNNISLSADDYARYQEIVESVIDLTPDLIAGYDAEGNAIVNKNALLERSIELLQEEQRLEAQRYSTGDNVRTLIKGIEEDIGNAPSQDQIRREFADKLWDVFESNQDWYDFFGFGLQSNVGTTGINNLISALNPDDMEIAASAANGNFWSNIPVFGTIGNLVDSLIYKDQYKDIFENNMLAYIKDMKEHEAEIVGKYMTQGQFDSLTAYLREYNHSESLAEVIKSYQQEYTDLLIVTAQSSEDFYDLNDQQQAWLEQYIQAAFPIPEDGDIEGHIYDAQNKISEFVTKFKNDAVLQSFVSDAANLSMGKDKKGNSLEIEDFLAQREALQEDLQKMVDDGKYDLETMNAIMELSVPDNYDEAIKHVQKLVGGLNEEYDKVKSQMTMSDLFLAYQISAEQGSLTFEELQQEIAALKKELGYTVVPAKTYTALTEEIEEYRDALSQTSEIISDDISVTQEYKDALIALGISKEDLNECFYEGNPLVVKNAKALNELVDKAKDSTAQNIKLAKSYARIEYRDLYKELKDLTKGTKVTDKATLNYIDSLYDQMRAVQRTIAKYSLLESELLGVANAYQDLEDAQAADEAADYGSKAAELVEILADAFNTAKLGTESARVAIEGLVPDEVFADADTLDDKMQKIYEYFTQGAVSQLFTIEFNDDGEIQNVEMSMENLKAFAESFMGDDVASVFQGTWDEFTLNPAIQTMEDFASACGITEEIAFAFLTELEKYDIGNALGDGSSILDQLLGDNFEYRLDKATQAMADAEKKVAEGTLQINDQEYMDAKNNMESLEEEALTRTVQWQNTSTQINEKGDELSNLQKEYQRMLELEALMEEYRNTLAQGGDGGEEAWNGLSAAMSEYEAILDRVGNKDEVLQKINTVSGEIDDLYTYLGDLEEPTEYVLTIAKEESEENIKEFKDEIAEGVANGDAVSINLEAAITAIDDAGLDDLEDLGFKKNPDGTWEATADITSEWYTKLDDNGKQKVLTYINMLEKDHVLDIMMGEGITTMEDIAKRIAGTLEQVAETLNDIANMTRAEYELEVKTDGSYEKVNNFKKLWDSISDKFPTITAKIETASSDFWNWLTGGDNVNGTANAHGTANLHGTAHAGGTWGAKSTETSLVGELGPEILVRGNRWTTVGDNGAEFTQVKKGDIIFNHKQTAELLKNGHITGRGKAYASGTVNTSGSRINTFTDYYQQVGESYENAANDFIETIDWIAIKLEEYAEKIDNLNAELDLAVGVGNKIGAIEDIISITKLEKNTLNAAVSEYYAEAQKYLDKLSPDLQEKAKSGAIDLQDITDQDTMDAINSYREYAQLAEESRTEALVKEKEILSLYKQRYDVIVEEGEYRISILEEEYEKTEALMDLMDSSSINTSEYYDGLITDKQNILAELKNEKEALEALFNSDVSAGRIPINSDEYREIVQQIADLDTQIVQCGVDLEDLALDKMSAVETRFEREIELAESSIDILQAQIDLQEESGNVASVKYYDELLKKSREMMTTLKDQREAMQDVLDEQVALGNIKVGSEEWYEMVGAINDVDESIIECTTDIESLQNAINDIHWDNFDELMNRFEYMTNEVKNFIDLMSDEDMVITPDDEDGWGALDVQWSDAGLASLALYAQQMEMAENAAQEYAAEIADLEKNRQSLLANGIYSETEYLEKLNELKDAQYDSIKAYQDAKDAIVDLNKVRIDSVKEGIEKEVAAYEKLIKAKKEALDSEKDLFDFQKNIEQQSKNIADIERKLAALANDNSASARAQRAKLKAELAEAKADLDEKYYDRSISDQQDALDKELEDFQAQKDAEVEKWEKYLENVEAIVAESLFSLQLQADTVYDTLESKAEEYTVSLSDYITSPWQNSATQAIAFAGVYDALEEEAKAYGMTLSQFLSAPWTDAKDSAIYQELFDKLSDIAKQYGLDLEEDIINAWSNGAGAIASYDDVFGNSASSTITQLGLIRDAWQTVIDKINEAAEATVDYHNNNTNTVDNNIPNAPSNNSGNNTPSTNPTVTNSGVMPNRTERDYLGVALAICNGNYGWGDEDVRFSRLEEKGFDSARTQAMINQITDDGCIDDGSWIDKYGINDLSPYHYNRFAKGTTGVDEDQWAIIDELGEELVMHATGGKLTFLSKGSAVIPHDISENLMQLGAMDPQDVLDRNRPQITAPHVINNEIKIDCSVGNMVHIEHCDQNTLPDVERLVNKAFDKHLQTLNNSIRRYVR